MRLFDVEDLRHTGLLEKEEYNLPSNVTLKDARVRLRKTQLEMAEMFGAALTTYAMWERQEIFPRADTKDKIEHILGVRILFGDEAPIMKNQALKDRRKALRLTQAQVAHKVGVSTIAYRLWENGGCIPKKDNQRRLEQVLGRGLIYASRNGLD